MNLLDKRAFQLLVDFLKLLVLLVFNSLDQLGTKLANKGFGLVTDERVGIDLLVVFASLLLGFGSDVLGHLFGMRAYFLDVLLLV